MISVVDSRIKRIGPKGLILFILIFLTGCFGGSSTEADGFKVTNKISSKGPLNLYQEVYVPTIINNYDCSTGPSIWFGSNELSYDQLKESIPNPKTILKALELTEPKGPSNSLESRFNKLLNEKSDRNKAEAERCSKLAKAMLGAKLVTSVQNTLDQHLQQLFGASVEARKNLELGSRFAAAIDQSLLNEASSACNEVQKLKTEVELFLKDKIKSCFGFAYGDENWSDQAGARFGCDHFGSQLCIVAERIFR